jgi:hypothetical protein
MAVPSVALAEDGGRYKTHDAIEVIQGLVAVWLQWQVCKRLQLFVQRESIRQGRLAIHAARYTLPGKNPQPKQLWE